MLIAKFLKLAGLFKVSLVAYRSSLIAEFALEDP
jgi:hypothetical protein